MLPGKLDLLEMPRTGMERLLLHDRVQPARQPTPFAIWMARPGPGVDLDHQTANGLVDHEVRSKVAKAGHFLTVHGDVENLVPAGHPDPYQIDVRIRMAGDGFAVVHRADRPPAGDIDADAKSFLAVARCKQLRVLQLQLDAYRKRIWLKIIWKMWQTGTAYNAALHLQNQLAHGSWVLQIQST